MKNEIAIVFPNQLFKNINVFNKKWPIYLVEEHFFFNEINFHKQKLVLHRASMKAYENYLKENNFIVHYIEAKNEKSDIRKFIFDCKKEKITAINIVDVVDYWLNKRLVISCKENDIDINQFQSPAFLNNIQEGNAYFDGRKRYFQTEFYIAQRKKRNILLQSNGEPIGGQWSYDADNRKKYPAKAIPPQILFPKQDKFVQEAIEYVQNNFSNNYGEIIDFFYPTNFVEAEKWLVDFLQNRFQQFGDYEDALVANEQFLHHSVISPLINIGLLVPQQIIDTTLAYAAKHNIAINNTEGFIRQIIGWREFIRIVYERIGVKQRTTNYWGFDRKIPASFWDGTTGIAPIDNVIKKVLKTGYLHHIERLMLVGNFMLLCEFKPTDVYKWYMEMFIDSYDWVMVPNVYGMILFADGGLITTKPYISGSNYVLKMSDYKKGAWCEIWDGLFWRFMHVNRSFFEKNPRLGMLLKTFDKMPDEKRNKHLSIAENYLQTLDQ